METSPKNYPQKAFFKERALRPFFFFKPEFTIQDLTLDLVNSFDFLKFLTEIGSMPTTLAIKVEHEITFYYFFSSGVKSKPTPFRPCQPCLNLFPLSVPRTGIGPLVLLPVALLSLFRERLVRFFEGSRNRNTLSLLIEIENRFATNGFVLRCIDHTNYRVYVHRKPQRG